ncbi:MAG: hypothetical protein ACXVY8_05415 [Gaiellaceae bacterium]
MLTTVWVVGVGLGGVAAGTVTVLEVATVVVDCTVTVWVRTTTRVLVRSWEAECWAPAAPTPACTVGTRVLRAACTVPRDG